MNAGSFQPKMLVRVVALAILGLILTACAQQEARNDDSDDSSAEEQPAEVGTLELCQPPWVNSPPQAHLVKYLIEDNYDWDVSITEADVGLCYESIAADDTDILADSWLPIAHKSYVEEHADEIQPLGVMTPFEASGLHVPSYVPIDSIEELNEVGDQFDWEIIGIEPGAGIMEMTEEMIDEYGLDYELVPSSDFGMTTALGDAIAAEEWIVVTLWYPHWAHIEYDLKRLEDPQLVSGEGTNLHITVHPDLENKAPEVFTLLDGLEIPEDVWNELIMRTAVEEEDPAVAVSEWAANNEEMIDAWVP